MESIDRVALPNASPEFTQALRVMYESEASSIGKAGLATFQLLEKINSARDAEKAEG